MTNDQINILLVDDESVLLESIRRRLQLRDFYVIAVDRGDKALDAARTCPPDVVILDLKMPGMSGKDVLGELKKCYPWLEVIILTGHGSFDPGGEEEFEKAYTCLAKPCDLDTLIGALAAAYRKTVMNRNRMTPEEMAFHLRETDKASMREILKKLKQLDKAGKPARAIQPTT